MFTHVRARPYGFTLVELLVVIAIIGVLMALLVPAVQKVREASARTQCQNNVKQLTLAFHSYESARKTMPPAWTQDISPWPNRQSDSVWYTILPYIEQSAIYDMGTPSNPAVASDGYKHKMAVAEVSDKVIPTFICPADSSNPTHSTGVVAFATTGNQPIASLAYSTGAYVVNVIACDPSMPTKASKVMLDGTSNTIVIGHKLEACDSKESWGVDWRNFNVPFAEPRNWSPYRSLPMVGAITYWNVNGGTGDPTTNGARKTTRNTNGVRGINQDFTNGSLPFQVQPRPGLCVPTSMVTPHSVMIVGLGDGSVRMIGPDVTTATWKNAWMPFDEGVLGTDW